jgi:ribosome maturation factor RimP
MTTTATEARVRALLEPIVEHLQLTIFDVEHRGGALRVFLDRDGGVDLDLIAEATRQLSRALDEADPIAGRYTLEVSSPGLERPLRTPEHFRWAVGKRAALKLTADVEGDRRLTGTIAAASDHDVTVALDEPAGAQQAVPLDHIEKARTIFEWGAAPKPGSPSRGPKASGKRSGPTAARAGG